MHFKNSFFLFFASIFFLSACGRKFKDTGLHVTGKVGEILVVCDQAIWNSEIKAHLDSQLTQFIMPYFPDVTTFELIHRKTQNFDGAIRRHRNILFLEIDSERKEKRLGLKMKKN